MRTKVYNFIEKETLAQVFSCEFFEISKNTSWQLLLNLSKSCIFAEMNTHRIFCILHLRKQVWNIQVFFNYENKYHRLSYSFQKPCNIFIFYVQFFDVNWNNSSNGSNFGETYKGETVKKFAVFYLLPNIVVINCHDITLYWFH